MPKLSFIICTRDRAGELVQSLDSIAAELARHGDAAVAEIIVVDNGSTDGTRLAVERWAQASPCSFQYVYEARPGLAAARNAGLDAASGSILAFTDDDCRLLPGYLDALFRHYAADTGPVVRGGRVELGDPTDQPCTIKTDPHSSWLADGVHPGGFIHGCNMTLHREVAERIGDFDERFGAGAPLKAAEETDFILRASFEGIGIHYVPDMAVAHFHGRKTVQEIKKLNEGYYLGNGALYGKHWNRRLIARHVYWDLKNIVREAIGRLPSPKMENGVSAFTYRDTFLWMLKGAFQYFRISGQTDTVRDRAAVAYRAR